MNASKQTLLAAAQAVFNIGSHFVEALAAEPEWPALSREEADVFIEGFPEKINAQLAARPELQPVEDFLSGFTF